MLPSLAAAISAPVKTASTPGASRAAPLSTDPMRAEPCGDRTKTATPIRSLRRSAK